MEARHQKPLLERTASIYTDAYLIHRVGLDDLNIACNDNDQPKNYSDCKWFQGALI
jgi:hypothetical protein